MVLATPHARGQEPGWKWPQGDIAVCWDNLVPDDHDDYRKQETRREWVKQAVTRNWAALSAVAFTGWGECEEGSEDGIQIKISWDGKSPSSSNVGRTDVQHVQQGLDGKPAMTLQFGGCEPLPQGCIISAALHEFGHALGFQHEHRRPDGGPGDLCLAIHPPSEGDPDLKEEDEPVFVSDEYDPNSIMNYCPVFGQLFDSISEADALGVEKHYGPDRKGKLYAKARWAGFHSCEKKYPADDTHGTAFRHLLGSDCYSCPKGYGRSIIPTDWITGPRACARGLNYRSATRRGDWGCPADAFKNGLLDQCFRCPSGDYERTAEIASDLTKVEKACVRKDWGLLRMWTIGLRPH